MTKKNIGKKISNGMKEKQAKPTPSVAEIKELISTTEYCMRLSDGLPEGSFSQFVRIKNGKIMSKKQSKPTSIIGIAVEESFGAGDPKISDVIFLDSEQKQVNVEGKPLYELTIDAEFSCPCCGKRIVIKIKKTLQL